MHSLEKIIVDKPYVASTSNTTTELEGNFMPISEISNSTILKLSTLYSGMFLLLPHRNLALINIYIYIHTKKLYGSKHRFQLQIHIKSFGNKCNKSTAAKFEQVFTYIYYKKHEVVAIPRLQITLTKLLMPHSFIITNYASLIQVLHESKSF